MCGYNGRAGLLLLFGCVVLGYELNGMLDSACWWVKREGVRRSHCL